jgi:hypothetical protein
MHRRGTREVLAVTAEAIGPEPAPLLRDRAGRFVVLGTRIFLDVLGPTSNKAGGPGPSTRHLAVDLHAGGHPVGGDQRAVQVQEGAAGGTFRDEDVAEVGGVSGE